MLVDCCRLMNSIYKYLQTSTNVFPDFWLFFADCQRFVCFRLQIYKYLHVFCRNFRVFGRGGREKIPALLRKRVGETLQVDIVAGRDFPADLRGYDLVIHCGACMFNRRYMLARIAQAKGQSVPITNYGITLAHLKGIMSQCTVPPAP